MKICVYGASSRTVSDYFVKRVENLSEALAKRNHSLVFGGGAIGLMGATARGFKKGGGKIVGISPKFFDVDGVLYKDCDEFVFTENMRQRKEMLDLYSDAFVATPGGIGTYDEFFEILTLKQLGMHTKPIVVYNIGGYFDKLNQMMINAIDSQLLNKKTMSLYLLSDNDEKIINYLENHKSERANFMEMKYSE